MHALKGRSSLAPALLSLVPFALPSAAFACGPTGGADVVFALSILAGIGFAFIAGQTLAVSLASTWVQSRHRRVRILAFLLVAPLFAAGLSLVLALPLPLLVLGLLFELSLIVRFGFAFSHGRSRAAVL